MVNVLVEIVPSHEWHLNFSPKLHQWRLSNGLEAIAEGHLRVWTDAIWGEKFKCHECTEQFLINTIKYWPNPFNLEEGKSQTSQVWKKNKSIWQKGNLKHHRFWKNKFVLCILVEKYLSPPIKPQLYFGIWWGKTYN